MKLVEIVQGIETIMRQIMPHSTALERMDMITLSALCTISDVLAVQTHNNINKVLSKTASLFKFNETLC